jgi:2-C-methyl-D-erythritol 4-phosphate cytidylyltransferase
MKKIFVIVPAAGSGSRFSNDKHESPKQYCQIFRQPIIYWTLKSLLKVSDVFKIVVAINPEDNYDFSSLNLPHTISIIKCGGTSRAQTVENAIFYINHNLSPDSQDLIMIHDAARCCIKAETINFLIKTYKTDKFAGAILAKPITDSVKSVSYDDTDLYIKQSTPRNGLYTAETPQIFKLDSLLQAIANKDTDTEYTDEASLFTSEHTIQIVENTTPNPKVTYMSDLLLAEFLLNKY